MSKAYEATNTDILDITIIVDDIYQEIRMKQNLLKEEEYIDVEYIQDLVEKTLMKYKHFETAKAYILYRQERKKQREKELLEKKEQVQKKIFMVTKQNGQKEVFDRKKIEKTYLYIAKELTETCPFEEIKYNLEKYIINEIKTIDITKLLIKTTINLISIQNTKWEYIAGRIASTDLYHQVKKTRKIRQEQIYTPESYLALMEEYIKN